MAARKKTIRCRVGEQRMTVVRVNGDDYDSHAGRSFEQALRAASPDRGARIDVFRTCGTDVGAVRLPSVYKKNGVLVKTFRYKGR